MSPMSADYTSDEMTARNTDKITVGDQTISGYAKGMPRANITNPSATSDTLTENGTLSSGTSETTTNGTTTATGTTDTTDGSTGTVTGATTDNGTTETKDSTTGNITGTTRNTATNSASTSDKKSTDMNAIVHDITSGRSTPIADLLSQAKGYILQSKAWVFLYKELDMCFCQSYLESEGE